jgi:amino acid transporter
MSVVLLGIVLAAMAWVIFAGLTHMNPHMAFAFPPGAFHLSHPFFTGLAEATLFALYNFGGYNNITYLGAEVRQPEKNIPRAIVLSVVVVAVIYLAMSISVLGVIPWREAAQSQSIISDFIARLYGNGAASVITLLILFATFGGIFALSLGYSRILYAAGAEGQFFRVFGRVHEKGRFPTVALLAINGAALVLCGFSVERLIQAQMIVQIIFQFIPQVLAIFAIRRYRQEIKLPFRMWLYPLPALIALAGWIYVALTPQQLHFVGWALVLMIMGAAAFLGRARQIGEWPFQRAR